MIVSLIAAASENNVIGKDGWMPWDLPAEIAYFRATTRGKTVIMGRKTIEAAGRPMPNRHNIVLSHDPHLVIAGADVVGSMEEAIELAKKDSLEEICVIGGEQIYRLALSYADRIYLSRVHTTIENGEAFFPEFDEQEWKLVSSERYESDVENAIPFTKLVYERVK